MKRTTMVVSDRHSERSPEQILEVLALCMPVIAKVDADMHPSLDGDDRLLWEITAVTHENISGHAQVLLMRLAPEVYSLNANSLISSGSAVRGAPDSYVAKRRLNIKVLQDGSLEFSSGGKSIAGTDKIANVICKLLLETDK